MTSFARLTLPLLTFVVGCSCATSGKAPPFEPETPAVVETSASEGNARAETASPEDAFPDLVQVLHRAARSERGRLFDVAPAQACDEALRLLAGTEAPFDAWAAALPDAAPDQRLVVLAVPDAGPVARAVVDRLRLSDPEGRVIELVSKPEALASDASVTIVTVVVAPRWTGEDVTPHVTGIERMLGMDRMPALVVVDLFEPLVGGETWLADSVMAGLDPAGLDAAVHFVLESRARAEIADFAAIARAHDVDAKTLRWSKSAVVR